MLITKVLAARSAAAGSGGTRRLLMDSLPTSSSNATAAAPLPSPAPSNATGNATGPLKSGLDAANISITWWLVPADLKLEDAVFSLVLDLLGAIGALSNRTSILGLFILLEALCTALITLAGVSLFHLYRIALLAAAFYLRSAILTVAALEDTALFGRRGAGAGQRAGVAWLGPMAGAAQGDWWRHWRRSSGINDARPAEEVRSERAESVAAAAAAAEQQVGGAGAAAAAAAPAAAADQAERTRSIDGQQQQQQQEPEHGWWQSANWRHAMPRSQSYLEREAAAAAAADLEAASFYAQRRPQPPRHEPMLVVVEFPGSTESSAHGGSAVGAQGSITYGAGGVELSSVSLSRRLGQQQAGGPEPPAVQQQAGPEAAAVQQQGAPEAAPASSGRAVS